MASPNLGLEVMLENSLQPSVPFNLDIQLLDCLVQAVAQSRVIATPPTTVLGDVGKSWVVAASPTGAWVGHTNHIALCTGVNLWRYIVPKQGWRFYIVANTADYRYNGSAWVAA